MITKDNKLEIFENFVIDRKLPKHIKEVTSTLEIKDGIYTEGLMISGNQFTVGGTSEGWGDTDVELEIDNAWQHIYQRRNKEYSINPTIGNKLRLKWVIFLSKISKKILLKEQSRDKRSTTIYENTENFFKEVKDSLKVIENQDILEIETFYIDHIKQAKELGQIALKEKLMDMFEVVTQESILLDKKYDNFLSEEDVVNFYGLYDIKNLHLTWIKNFNRIIPKNIFELKLAADEIKVFDNYVILHTDATGDVIGETNEEREARIKREKDPILFGVIKNSRKLYYIGDWEDEYCDLTIDKVLEVLKKEVNLNSVETIKGGISKMKIDK